ncbi:reverse transcriptase domain-containing protein [Tanacetum coccineum]|uniref:Reverse transcriptase domain-containing protein n=1 Tax=Tanacetum coccineum TaxID=301880 RepID=A0ABQ5GPH5_9ASTR
MADQRTIAELLCAPTEGYAEAIVPSVGLEKNKEPPRSILTWEDLVSKFINEFFPPSRTTNLRNEISNFEQRFGESFHEAWDRYKDLLRACPHHGFTELHQLDTFYNALNPTDQDSLNSAAGGNLLERSTRDVLTIIENKSKVRNSRNKSIVSQVKSSDVNSSSSSEIAKLTHAVNQQTSDVTTAMTAILKQFQATPPPASVKAVEEICVTCGGAHPYYQCLAADGNTFRDNIQGYVSAAAVNYNQGNFDYRPPSVANQIRPPDTSYQAPTQQNQVVPLSKLEKIKKINEVNIKAMQAQINKLKNELRKEMQTLIQASMSNQTNELKNMMASFFQMNTASTSSTGSLPSNIVANPRGELKAINTRSGLVLDGTSIPMPPPFINPEEDERVEETLMDPELAEYTIKVPPPLVQKAKPTSLKNYVVHQKMLKSILSNKEKHLELANTPLNENCSAAGIAKIFVPVGKFTFPADFVIVDYESDPRVPLILGRPFLRTARALIDVHGEEMILRDGDERLILNMRHDTSSYSNKPKKESINMIDIYNVSHKDYLEDLFANEKATNHQSGNPTFSSHTDLTSPEVINPLSGNPTPISEPVTKSSSSPIITSFEESELEFGKNSKHISQVIHFHQEMMIQSEPFMKSLLRATPDKNVKKTTNASLILEDFNPPLYELPFHKEVPRSKILLSFSSKNEEKVFNPGILTSKGVHTSLLPELSH